MDFSDGKLEINCTMSQFSGIILAFPQQNNKLVQLSALFPIQGNYSRHQIFKTMNCCFFSSVCGSALFNEVSK